MTRSTSAQRPPSDHGSISAGHNQPRAKSRWPWQRSLQYRIAATYGALFFVVLLFLAIWIGGVIYRSYLEARQQDLVLTAFLAANALEDPLSGYGDEFAAYERSESEDEKDKEADTDKAQNKSSDDESEDGEEDGEDGDPQKAESVAPVATAQPTPAAELPRLQQVAQTYAGDADARVTILDHQGDPIADSQYNTGRIDNQQGQPEVQAALAGDQASSIRKDPLTGERTLFAAAPIQQGAKLLGVVQISQPVNEAMEGVRQIFLSLAAALLSALILAGVVGVWMGRRLVRPLREMETAAMAVAEGDLNQQVVARTDDELGALARAFNYMVNEVRSHIERQQLFISNASHELRTPLTNIKLRSEALRTQLDENPALAARYADEIDSEADRLIRLANDLLDLSRLEADGSRPPARPIDMAALLHEAGDVMQLRAQRVGVTLEVSASPDLPPALGSRDQVEAAIINLMDNAIKYTPPGGRVWLEAEARNGRLEVRVSDTGMGIPADELPYIFDRFYRVDKVRSRQENGVGSGAGIGLSIAKQLVEQNGGQIWAESIPQQGTTFVISFRTA